MNIYYEQKKKPCSKKGFSLVELMVSLTIFSIVMVSSIGTLLVIIDANAKAQALYSAMSNLSFAVDSITRNIRMGFDYRCFHSNGVEGESMTFDNDTPSNNECATGDNAISFTREKDLNRVGYRKYSGTGCPNGCIQQRIDRYNRATGTWTADTWLTLTSADTFVDTFMIVTEDTNGITYDTIQPKVSILIKGRVNNGLDTDTQFTLQSHVTQRTINY